jgi:hypothetical protein
MAENRVGLLHVAESMRGPLEEYAQLVKDLAGEQAKALTLFGAIAAATFDPERHTARSVLVVDRVDLSFLRELANHGLRLGKAGIAAPLVMTPGYIKASLDTFPLELIEISQQHVTVFGEDYFVGLCFEDRHIRLQCERELKVVMIGLRQGLLAAAGREILISALEVDVGEGLMRTLRGLLWLRGHHEPMPAAEVLPEIEKIAGRKLNGVRTALDPTAQHGWSEFEDLYRDVEALGEIADAH